MLAAVALALGIAMDATAVAATRGVLRRPGEAVVLPLVLGPAHAVMAALGWLAARAGGETFRAWDHWIAFTLLGAIGGKMLYEGWRDRNVAEPAQDAPPAARERTGILLYLLLALATSIDAMAAGVTLTTIPVAPWITLTLIGGITLACTAIGYALGRTARARFGPRLAMLGGLILVGLGVRVLAQHL